MTNASDPPPRPARAVWQGDRTDRRHWLQPRNFSSSGRDAVLEWLVPKVTGRTVLDVGCATGFGRPDWIHGEIVATAQSCLGMDIDGDGVTKVKSAGYDVVQGDAEAFDLDRTFEVIFVGELIEHLGCPGAFLESVARHLSPGGHLILTTPNPFAISNFVYRVLPGEVRINRDHTCWFCVDTVRQLFDRYGFEADVSYLQHETPGSARRAAASAVRRLLPARVAWNTLGVVGTVRTSDGRVRARE